MGIFGEFRTAYGQGVGFQIKFEHVGFKGIDDEVFFLQFFFQAEQGSRIKLFPCRRSIRESQTAREEIDFGFWDILGEF